MFVSCYGVSSPNTFVKAVFLLARGTARTSSSPDKEKMVKFVSANANCIDQTTFDLLQSKQRAHLLVASL